MKFTNLNKKKQDIINDIEELKRQKLLYDKYYEFKDQLTKKYKLNSADHSYLIDTMKRYLADTVLELEDECISEDQT